MKKFLKILAIIIGVLIILNFLLEPIVLRYVNKTLDEMEGYKGHVEDIDIALWRGAYRIDSLRLDKIDGDFPEPFFSTHAIDISIEWAALFKGAIVGEIILEQPRLVFAVEPSGEAVQTGEENDWIQTITDLIPIKINRFQVVDGKIFYKDYSSHPKVEMNFHNFNALATNLNNVVNPDELLPSHLEVNAETSGNGTLGLKADMNILKETPDLDLNMEMKDLDLTYLKDFTEAYANFTFKEGTLYLSSEVAMKDGKYDGYVKPVLEHVKVIDLDNESTTFWRKAWEVVIGTLLEVFENQSKEQFATKVPFSGDVNSSSVGIWTTLGNILRNAFIDAFNKNVDQTVNINSVDGDDQDKGFFKTLFNGDEKKEK